MFQKGKERSIYDLLMKIFLDHKFLFLAFRCDVAPSREARFFSGYAAPPLRDGFINFYHSFRLRPSSRCKPRYLRKLHPLIEIIIIQTRAGGGNLVINDLSLVIDFFDHNAFV